MYKNKDSLEFDIRLDSKNGEAGSVNHGVRSKIFKPLPSNGYIPVFGSLPEIELYQGFSVSLMDKFSKNPLSYKFKSSESPLLFAYLLSGERCFSFDNSSEEIKTSSGQWYIGYIPEKSGKGIIKGKPKICSVKFRMDPLALFNLLDGEVDDLLEKIRSLLKKLECGKITLTGSMTPAMKAAAFKLISSGNNPGFSMFGFESGVLDLLTIHLEELSFSHEKFYDDFRLKIAHDVREILMDSFSSPPKIKELAGKFNTTPFKLKSLFIKVFGISISDFINKERMETARIYLESGNYNVNEAAAEIGYINTSSFISSFNSYYGVNPGDFMRQSRKVYLLN